MVSSPIILKFQEKSLSRVKGEFFKDQLITLCSLFSCSDGKIYDAYVIYPRSCKTSPEGASSVEYFVHQILPDVLENKCGYNLCIYGRDLLPGQGKLIHSHQGQKLSFFRKLSDELLDQELRSLFQVLGPELLNISPEEGSTSFLLLSPSPL